MVECRELPEKSGIYASKDDLLSLVDNDARGE